MVLSLARAVDKNDTQAPVSATNSTITCDHTRREPIALISVSSRLIDTLLRAFNKFYKGFESTDQIWIAFILVPHIDKAIYHHVEGLAKRWGIKNLGGFLYEYVFEWEIPE